MLMEAEAAPCEGRQPMTTTAYDHHSGASPTGSLDVGVTPGLHPATVDVYVSGEIDRRNADLLHETLLTALTCHRAVLLLNLEQVTACDCSGLHALLSARLAALRAGRSLRITSASRCVHQLLHLSSTSFLFK